MEMFVFSRLMNLHCCWVAGGRVTSGEHCVAALVNELTFQGRYK